MFALAGRFGRVMGALDLAAVSATFSLSRSLVELASPRAAGLAAGAFLASASARGCAAGAASTAAFWDLSAGPDSSGASLTAAGAADTAGGARLEAPSAGAGAPFIPTSKADS